MDNPNLSAAQRLADLGIAVFPCATDKRPRPGVRWKEEATTDQARIASWWRRWPDSLPAFEPGRHQLVAIDCDRHGKGDGVAALEEIARANDEDPRDWPTVETPSTGRHIFFRQDGSLTNARGTLPAGIDVRGTGGYVIAEGATLPDGRDYHALADGLISAMAAGVVPSLPTWLAGIIVTRPEPAAATVTVAPAPQTPRQTGGGQSEFFRKTNDAALRRLDDWVPGLFPRARYQPGTGAYRVSSRELGRDLQEDLSLSPAGIVDFGVADMGDANQGKRTPIDVIIEHAGAPDAVEAARWLCDKLGLDAAAEWDAARAEPAIDLSRLKPRAKALAEPAQPEPQEEDDDLDDEEFEPEIDRSLANVDGVLGEIVDWITACDPEGNRLLALAAALPLMSTLLGRRMATPTGGGGGLELYVVSLLPSSGGKSVAMDGITRILEVAGLDNQHLAPPEFRSGSAFGDILCRMPLSISIIDEIADYLGPMLSERRQSHQQELEKYLKEQWGKGFKSFKTAHSRTAGSTKVFAPCYSIYGVTTPESLFRVIKSQHLTSGFINRFTVINAVGQGSPHRPTELTRHPPDRLIENVRSMYRMGQKGSGNLGFGDKNQATDPEPVLVPWETQHAEDCFLAFEAECKELRDSLGDLGKVYGRTAFMAVKMATIRACGRISPVTLDDIQWGIAIAKQSADLFRAELAGKMLDPLSAGELLQKIAQQFKAPTKRGAALMEKYGAMRLPRRFLWGNLKHHTSRHPGEFDSALKAMETNGELKIDKGIVIYRARRKAP